MKQKTSILSILVVAGMGGLFVPLVSADNSRPNFVIVFTDDQGYDEYFGIPYSHDIHPFHPRQKHFKFPPLPLLDGETVIEMDPDADYLTKRVTERAVSFIKANKDKPFFLYIPHPDSPTRRCTFRLRSWRMFPMRLERG